MEEQQHRQGHGDSTTKMPPAETKDYKFTDFMGKKEERAQEDVPMIDLEMEHKHAGTELKEKHALLEEHRTRSNSSSSSDEEVEEGGETKKRKKKGLKDKIKEKISREKGDECTNQKDTFIAMEESDTKVENGETTNSEEKKGFLEKIKEKLPGQHKKTEEGTITHANEEESSGDEMNEKKGILDKIKEKLPGHHKNENEPKEKEN